MLEINHSNWSCRCIRRMADSILRKRDGSITENCCFQTELKRKKKKLAYFLPCKKLFPNTDVNDCTYSSMRSESYPSNWIARQKNMSSNIEILKASRAAVEVTVLCIWLPTYLLHSILPHPSKYSSHLNVSASAPRYLSPRLGFPA